MLAEPEQYKHFLLGKCILFLIGLSHCFQFQKLQGKSDPYQDLFVVVFFDFETNLKLSKVHIFQESL